MSAVYDREDHRTVHNSDEIEVYNVVERDRNSRNCKHNGESYNDPVRLAPICFRNDWRIFFQRDAIVTISKIIG